VFKVKRKSVWEILAWYIDTIKVIHPFLDWNRRTLWKYTNLRLKWEWYKQINWENFRPFWERHLLLDKIKLLNIMLKELENENYIKK
jgi:fido (protein-threonine AMPylation protein)